MDKDVYIRKAIAWAEQRSNSLKAKSEGYEDPIVFKNKLTDEEVQPDVSYTSFGGVRHYIEVVLKGDNIQQSVSRWKLFSLLASQKRGKLHLLTPRGHKAFAERLVRKYNVNALIYSI